LNKKEPHVTVKRLTIFGILATLDILRMHPLDPCPCLLLHLSRLLDLLLVSNFYKSASETAKVLLWPSPNTTPMIVEILRHIK
jgi:hypothetical protein